MSGVLLGEVCRGHLQPQEAVVLRHLLDRGAASREQLIRALYGHRADGGPLYAHKLVDFYIYRVRRRLAPGWRLMRNGFDCWRLTSEQPRRIAA